MSGAGNGYGSISIHAPVKGATRTKTPRLTPSRYFNPRSREGSDPVRPWPGPHDWNFNPRSREGSDPMLVPSPSMGRDFNPRSREGSDGDVARFYAHPTAISIHAPVKGATIFQTRRARPAA